MKKITFVIDGKLITASENDTILEAAKKNNIFIPSLCNHPDLPPRSSCRLCLVEINGLKTPVTSCNTKVKDGMVVKTQSEHVQNLRKTNLELIFGEHVRNCPECLRKNNCTILHLAANFKSDINRFPHRKKTATHFQYGNIMNLETQKCIECGNCVMACKNQGINHLQFLKYNQETTVKPTKENLACIACGQCALHCPVGAIYDEKEIDSTETALKSSKKIVIQFAPSIRVAIGEEFGMKPGEVVTGQLIAALKELGADWVVDIDTAADFTTVAEAMELKERIIENKNLPMFTSCCPSWILYVEATRPDLIPNLTTIRSPHIISGGIIKQVLAKRADIPKEDIIVVSIMPCTSKKFEAKREELWHNKIKPVDIVITTRELAIILKKHNIDPSKLKPIDPDTPMGVETGSGSIYGASGGVMEAAVRTAHRLITGKELKKINLEEVRGMADFKSAKVKIGDKIVKIAVANGQQNAIKLLDELKDDPHKYDYIEVMACAGGCIGGGGQPFSIDNDIRKKRQNSLYSVDEKNIIRLAHENPIVKDVLKKELRLEKMRKKILETTFKKRPTFAIKKIISKVK